MPDGSHSFASDTEALIGPNAILQLKAPVNEILGEGVMAQMLDLCRVPMPTGDRMISEQVVGRVHHTLWQLFPDRAQAVSERAGLATADYIRKNRIPRVVRIALRMMPAHMAERMLTKAIENHAWTFCGSGALRTNREDGSIHFLLRDNPLADVDAHPQHPCHWHSAVFERLFTSVLGKPYYCQEVSCCAMGGDTCHFVMSRNATHPHFKGLKL